MKILGIEHLAIAVKNIDESSPFWSHILKLQHRATETVESEGVITDIYDTGQGKVELLESLGKDSPINSFLENRGPGIHHVCFEVVVWGAHHPERAGGLVNFSMWRFLFC